MPIKCSTVIVDRLAFALERQGVKMKRRALLETASYAFGFSNSNAFTAASQAGDITPPPATPVGRVELADGTGVLLLWDPLAGSTYGIDESFLEDVVENERRERIGVTPYGHLLNLGSLGDAVFPPLGGDAPHEPTRTLSLVETAIRHLDGYTADEGRSDVVGQAENMLGLALSDVRSGDDGAAVERLRAANELVGSDLIDDAERNIEGALDAIEQALGSIARKDRVRETADEASDAGLRPFLMAALEQIDLEIENRKAGGDPSAWADMMKVSDLGHAAMRAVVQPVSTADDDETSIRVSRDDLRKLLGAAQSYSEDVNTGVEDGTYDEADNQDIGDLDEAIANIDTRLAMEVPTGPRTVNAPKDGMITVHVARIVNKHGSDIRVALTEEDLNSQVAGYCRECWDEISDRKGVPTDHAGMTDAEVVSVYYAEMERAESEEFVDESTFDLAISTTLTGTNPSGECVRCGSLLKANGRCGDETCPFSDTLQGDRQGWAGHPQRDPNPREDGAVVPGATSSVFANADEIASELENGASADIWYDAQDHGDPDDEEDPDRIAEDAIGRTQDAMMEAARILRHLKPVMLSDGGIIVDGVIQSKTRISERAVKDAGDDIRYITYQNGEPGDVTISMVAAMGLAYRHDRDDSVALTNREFEWLGVDETLNDDCALPVSLGASALWRGRKWLVSEIEFSFADQGDDSRDDAAALRSADAHMEHLAPYIESLGGHMILDEDATEFGHELAILIPFEIAMQSASWKDWTKALSYLLSTEAEKKAGLQVSAEYTAQKEMGRGIYSVEPAGDTVWDGTFDALRWGRGHAEVIYNGTSSHADDYAHSPMAPRWVRDWSGSHPFEVQAIGLDEVYAIIG